MDISKYPQHVQTILKEFELEDNTYESCKALNEALQSICWACEYDLNAEIITIKKLKKVMEAPIKTIDINALEWFDKTYGNSYFAGTITVDYGMKTERTFKMHYQYGYGDAYRYEAFRVLKENQLIPEDAQQLWQYCRDNNIIVRYSKKENCLKRELKNI